MRSGQQQSKIRYTIKELPEQLRPRERLLKEGSSALSDAELLAIILRTGSSSGTAIELGQQLIASVGQLRRLAEMSLEEFSQIKGVGMAKVAQIKAALELGRRAYTGAPASRIAVRTPSEAAELVMSQMRYLDRENLRVIMLDSKNHVLGISTVSVGTVNASLAHPRECFKEAVKQSAVAVIFVHNHPSGDPTPSEEDKALTRQLREAGEVLGIEVLDHIIIGDGVFVTLKEQGLL